MFDPVEPFDLVVNKVTIHVQEVNLPGYRAFHASFSSKRRPITVVRATNRSGEKFWTTVPEDESRQGEAEGVGNLIQEYLTKLEA